MKNVVRQKPAGGDLRPEYRFDYSKAKPNRFAKRFQPGSLPVVLDPDVAEVFQTGSVVNDVLRSIIRVMPRARRSARTPTSSRRRSRKVSRLTKRGKR